MFSEHHETDYPSYSSDASFSAYDDAVADAAFQDDEWEARLLIGPPPEPLAALAPHELGSPEQSAPPQRLDEFLALLADPEYQPPEYSYVMKASGMSIDPEQNWAPYVQRLGGRKLAVDIEPIGGPEDNAFRITAVHGIEPLYRGGPLDAETTPRDRVIEGKVLETSTLDMSQTLDCKGITELPMMRVQLDPKNPDQTLWVPHEQLTSTKNGQLSNALVGDVAQVRIDARIIHDPQHGAVASSWGLAGNNTATTPYLMEEGAVRRVALAERLTETAELITDIAVTDNPHELASAVNGYFAGRLKIETILDKYGLRELHRLDITQRELDDLALAVHEKQLPPGDYPAYLEAALSTGTAAEPTHALAYMPKIDDYARWLRLYGSDTSVQNMTVTELADLSERFAAAHLLTPVEPGVDQHPPDVRLHMLLDVLDVRTREITVSNIRNQLFNLPSYQLFWSEACYIISDLIREAPAASARRTVAFVAGAAQNCEDLKQLSAFGRMTRNGNDDLLSKFLAIAGDAIELRDPGRRTAYGITDADYSLMVDTARAVLTMIHRAGSEGARYLTAIQRTDVRELEQFFAEQNQ